MMTDQSQPQAYTPHPQEDSLQTPPEQTYAEAYVPPSQPQQVMQSSQPVTQADTPLRAGSIFQAKPATEVGSTQQTAQVNQEGLASQEASPSSEPAITKQIAEPSKPATQNQDKQPLFPNYVKPPQEEVILEWDALSRPFKQRSRQFFSTLVIIVILVSLILFFAGQFIPIAVIVALAFLAYILSVIPPTFVRHQITTFGLRVEDNLYYWEELGRFWFTEKYGQPILHIEVDRFPGRLTLLLGQQKVEDMREIFSEILLEQQPEATFFDKAAAWLENKIPLEPPSEIKN